MLMDAYDRDMDIAVQREEAAEIATEMAEAKAAKIIAEIEARAEKSEMRGIMLTKEAIKLHAQGKSAAEIAKILEIPEAQARLMIS